MRITKRNLILLILALVICLGAGYWAFSVYRVNKSIDQLRSDDWQVREQATENLTNLGKLAVEPLITALKSNDANIRWRAARALGKTKDSRAIEPLALALKDEDKRVRYRAVAALEEIGNSRVIELLVSALKDNDVDVRERIARALGNIGKPAVELLISTLKNEDDEQNRMKLAEAWSEIYIITHENYIKEQFISMLKCENNNYYDIRMDLVEMSGEIYRRTGDLNIIEALDNILSSAKDWDIRSNALESLKQYRTEDERIMRLISHRNWDECLKIGKPAIKPLIDALNSSDKEIRQNVYSILVKITGKDFGMDLYKWRMWYEQNKERSK